jgi:hypothetical protein
MASSLGCEHPLLRGLARLADRVRDFVRLAEADADAPLAVAHGDDRVEGEAAPALDHLGDAIDVDDAFHELRLRLLGPGSAASSMLWLGHARS